MTGWSINAAELRIPGRSRLAAHRMLVIADPSGQAVRQLNGLASWYDRHEQRWRHKPIGYLASDRLRGYDSLVYPQTFMPIHGCAPRSPDITGAVAAGHVRVLASGLTRLNAEERLRPALKAMERINAMSEGPEGGAGLPYPFLGFGPNSNSFFATLLAAMEFEPPVFARPARLVPGASLLLLDPHALAAIRSGL